MIDGRLIARTAAEFGLVLLSSLLGCWAAAVLQRAVVTSTIDVLTVGTDKTNIMFALLGGLPLGSIAGIFVAGRIVSRRRSPDGTGLIVAVFLTFTGVAIMAKALDCVGGWTLPLFPLIVSGFSQAGYHLGVGVQRRYRQRQPHVR